MVGLAILAESNYRERGRFIVALNNARLAAGTGSQKSDSRVRHFRNDRAGAGRGDE
jgi:hypothetical protein